MTIAERVAKGYQWLLENRPEETKGIDARVLNVADAHVCPLGQTRGYWETLNELFPTSADMENPEWWTADTARNQWAIAHGFQVVTDDMDQIDAEYAALNYEWRRVLAG